MPASLRFPSRPATAVFGAAGASAAAAAALSPWMAAAVGAIAVAGCIRRGREPSDPPDLLLRRHLAVSRRRGERAHVLVASVPGHRPAIGGHLRISDSAVCHHRGDHTVLVAVVDPAECVCERVTARLRESCGPELDAGWATFPDEGSTLDALTDLAASRRSALSATPAARRRLTGQR